MTNTGIFSKLFAWADKNSTERPPVLRPIHRLLRIVCITIKEYAHNDLSLRSSALTYAILLSLVPMLAMGTAVIKGMGGGDQLRNAAYSYLDTLKSSSTQSPSPATNVDHPPAKDSEATENQAGLTEYLRNAVDTLFDYVDRTNFAALGTFGILGILLSVLLVLSQIEGALNHIWKVKNGRPLLRRITDYLALLILLPISINVAFAASAFLQNQKLANWMDVALPFGWLQNLLLKPIPVIIIGLTFYTIYIFFPNTHVKNRCAMLGAMLAALCWFGIQNLYITLQVGVAKYNAIYGSFATLPLFLVWIYLGWLFILLGAQIAWALQHLEDYQLQPIPERPCRSLSCAYDLMDRTHAAFAKQHPVTAPLLFSELSAYYSKAEIDKTLAQLTEGGLLHFSQKNEQVLPAGPMNQAQKATVLQSILGEDCPDSVGGRESATLLDAARSGLTSTDEKNADIT